MNTWAQCTAPLWVESRRDQVSGVRRAGRQRKGGSQRDAGMARTGSPSCQGDRKRQSKAGARCRSRGRWLLRPALLGEESRPCATPGPSPLETGKLPAKNFMPQCPLAPSPSPNAGYCMFTPPPGAGSPHSCSLPPSPPTATAGPGAELSMLIELNGRLMGISTWVSWFDQQEPWDDLCL